MTWTAPKTWSTGEALTASDMNTHVRDNLNALKEPPTNNYECNQGSDYTTALTTFVDVDSTNLSLDITTTGGDVLVGFTGAFSHDTVNGTIFLNIAKDGVAVAADDGITLCRFDVAGSRIPMSFAYLITGLAANTYNFELMWKTTAGNATMFAGAGTANRDIHPQFWVREI